MSQEKYYPVWTRLFVKTSRVHVVVTRLLDDSTRVKIIHRVTTAEPMRIGLSPPYAWSPDSLLAGLPNRFDWHSQIIEYREMTRE